jgi:uncharacterized protein
MADENIRRVILKYRGVVPADIKKRELKVFSTKFDKAHAIIGPRRAGKTFFLYSLLKNEKNPVLLNFEDNLLDELNRRDLNKILDYSKELLDKEKLSFFFDEIQGIDGWEKFIVSLLNEHYPVFVTGSNSKLLSREIASSLRGKCLAYLLLPLSFREYLSFSNVALGKNFEYTDEIFEIKKHFRKFMKYGGFPEIVLSDSLVLKNKLVNNYFDSVLYKDLVDRLDLKNIKLVEVTMKYALNLFGNMFSISAFERYLKSNKIPYSLEDVYRILKGLQDVFMVSYVKEYSKSFKKSEFSKSKVYLFDTSYIHFLSREPKDKGRILENTVFIELFRRQGNVENKNIFYFKSKGECDFIVAGRDDAAIQVTHELTEKNRERELTGLLEAMRFFKLKRGLILTLDQSEELVQEGKEIVVMPVWKWLLER